MTFRRLVPLAVALTAAVTPAHAQQPTLSRLLQPLLQRDTSVAVWVFARPSHSIDEIARLVTASGGRVRRQSAWLNAVSAQLPMRGVVSLMRAGAVRHIQPLLHYRARREPVSEPAVPGPRARVSAVPRAPRVALDDSLYGPSAMPFRRLNIFPLVDRGFRGTGIKIALLDTGFETLRADFANAHVIAQRDFVFNDSVVRNQAGDTVGASQHGTSTWSLLAADDPGNVIGIAPDALYLLAKTEDIRSETRVEEDNWVAALEWADSLGAAVASSSLGYLCFDNPSTHTCDAGSFRYSFAQLNGDVAVTTVAADVAAQKGIIVVNAMGNGGPGFRSLDTPADADSIISVGAEDSTGVIATFSSRGPTADGRIKPDLTAPGVSVFIVDVLSGTGYSRGSGTSFSTPITAGAAALFKQVHPWAGPIDVRTALRLFGTHASQPDTIYGWGAPDLLKSVTFPKGLQVTAPADTTLTTVTPSFDWSVPNAPAFALPFTYRVRVSPHAAFDSIAIDTTLTATTFSLLKPLQPGARLVVDIAATGADTATVSFRSVAYVVPPWAKLLTLNQASGSTIRDVRPTFRWTSVTALAPPGPFQYTVRVFRDDGTVDLEQGGIKDTQFVATVDLERNTPYHWTLTPHLGSDSTTVQSLGTFVITSDESPAITTLFQNFPNPFPNNAIGAKNTCIWFDLATAGEVKLEILDILGHVVRRLIPGNVYGPVLRSGRYGRPLSTDVVGCDPALEWDGTDANGNPVPRGIYLAKLDTPDGTQFKRIVFLGAGN